MTEVSKVSCLYKNNKFAKLLDANYILNTNKMYILTYRKFPISLSDQMQLEAKSILQVLGRWSRRPDFSRLRQLRHADTTPDSLRILDLQIYSLNWLSYGPRAWPLFNQMPPPPPNKSQTPVRTHSYHLITLILHRSLLFFFFFFFF